MGKTGYGYIEEKGERDREWDSSRENGEEKKRLIECEKKKIY